MTRPGSTFFILFTVTLVFVVSGAPAGLISNLVGTVTTVTPAIVSSLIKVVSDIIDPRRLIIVMNKDTRPIINAAANFSTSRWTEAERVQNIRNIVHALKQHAQRTQGPVTRVLKAAGTQYQANWISNTIDVLDCPPHLVQEVTELLMVKEVIYDAILDTDFAESEIDLTNNQSAPVGWGPTKINAPDVWATNNIGQNVIVGNIDSGVRGTHEALVNNFVGPFGWYDPREKTAAPFDAGGHGTHTMATIAGEKGVGVAPGAKWMACKGCSEKACSLSVLIACAQFMLCPTDTDGNNCDPSKAPHVISNSWGTIQGSTYFQPSLDAWRAARIIPVFSAGNSGRRGCGSIATPGDSPMVLTVGATDRRDGLGSFSSLGPTADGLVKPDISAPGVGIRSAWKGNDNEYMTISGTSMATPHVTGTIALALSARPGLSFDAMKTILTGSTEQALRSAATCGETTSTMFPNNQYGHGRINALKVVQAAIAF
ncbi:hypothetical protein CCR75_004783 [Bremia lactucae]|uniref:subtilisin n=1 Tax=Bremia lactucae TaxID=4779 RepID=A0A976FG44_BRELC|nr:hypothetical protein CCR75_004783 [Bremia lactucae]